MHEENWVEQYKGWKDLKPFQIKLLDEGPQSLSQTWLFNTMWSEWKALKHLKEKEKFENNQSINKITKDPWYD